MDEVLLVNVHDETIGTKEKLQAHIDGDLHRAFSIVLYNDCGAMLIHKRAITKYHCGGLWTNACCSHPRPGESVLEAAKRRLKEELGYTGIFLKPQFSFIYKEHFANGLTEYEFDHVLVGRTNENPPRLDPEEIEEYRWTAIGELREEMQQQPERFTVWFRILFEKLHPC